MIIITQDHAAEFLSSLYPCGENSYLSNPTRYFLSGVIGKVPQGLCFNVSTEYEKQQAKNLADTLRQLADHIEKGYQI